ncbi:MAG TPA: histidine phosphatase family protein [Candidatus Babeliales bacterium]|nr:histidine phosphatase family protein [Candidatus Babeliales bacterium]
MIALQSFYFLRHGQTDHNLQQIYMGHQDIALNHLGKEQALNARQLVEQYNIATVCYSPLARTYETMLLATANLSCDKTPLHALQAINGQTETEQDFCHRIQTGINQALVYPAPVLIVSHGDVYKRLCHLLGLAYHAIENGEIVYFKLNNNNSWEIKRDLI